jgi:PAS domain S-box-containing protein
MADIVRILLVEDNPGDARLMIELFKDSRSPKNLVSTVSTLEGALRALSEGGFDLIILDLNLPDSSDLETLKGIIEVTNHAIPVIVLTGVNDDDMGLSAIECGADDYMVKRDVNRLQIMRSIRYTLERKKMENALHEEREIFRRFLEYSPIYVFFKDNKTRSLLLSRNYENMLGRPLDELLGKTMDEIFPSDFAKKMIADDLAILNGGKAVRLEEELDGRFYETIKFPIELMGRSKYLAGFTIDITDRVKAGMETREARNFLDSVIEQSPVPTWISDDRGNLIRINQACCELLGITPDVVLGKYNVLEDSIVIQSGTLPLIRSVYEQGRSVNFDLAYSSGYLKYDDPSGDPDIYLNVTIFPVRDESGRMTNAVIQHKNTTERVMAERALRASEEELRQLNAQLEKRVADRTSALEKANGELESFSFSVSHDLRAPLRHITGFLELLKRETGELPGEKTRHYMDVITRSAERMEQLIDDLLAFSRMSRSEMTSRQVNMELIAGEALAAFSEEIRARNIRIEVATLCRGHGDEAMLRVVFMNLISNAVKFTSKVEGPEIKIGCERAENEIIYFVRDNGAGFDMKYSGKLFGVFQRLHSADDFDGTGIGLATIKRIIDRHHGRVWAEGAPGQGACFWFSLPVAAGE